MKNKFIPIICVSLLLMSCTMTSIDVHQPPGSFTDPSYDFSSESLTSSETSSSSSETSTSTGPEYINLTFEEAEKKINVILDYIKSDAYQNPNHFTQKIISKDISAIEIKKNVTDRQVDFKNHVSSYKKVASSKPPLGKENITSSTLEHVFQGKDNSNVLIVAKANAQGKTYKSIDVSKEGELDSQFNIQSAANPNLISFETQSILNLVKAIKLLSSSLKQVDIKEEKTGSMSFNIKAETSIVGKEYIELSAEIKDYNIVSSKVGLGPKGQRLITNETSSTYTYDEFSYVYPDLSEYKDENTPEKEEDQDSSSLSQNQ